MDKNIFNSYKANQAPCIKCTKNPIFYDKSLTFDTLPYIICCIQRSIQESIQDEKAVMYKWGFGRNVQGKKFSMRKITINF